MKKLLLFLFLACAANAQAQKATKNSVSITVGPNWFFQFSETSEARHLARTGFSAGFDYTRALGSRWQAKIAFRFSEWHSISQMNNLRWPSEYGPDGSWVPDPNLPHSIEIPVTDKAWQWLAGIRYLGKPAVWNWYADLDAGITDYIEKNGGKAPLRFTVGAGAGLEWRPPGQHFGVFVQPLARYIFRIGSDTLVDHHFLSPALDAGARWHF